MLSKIVAIIFAGFLIWMLYRYIRSNPEALSRESLTKSFSSMGFLGIALIIFIALVIMLLRRT
jgi:TRAP-type C4-dicarboxylate transport system permease small subunit